MAQQTIVTFYYRLIFPFFITSNILKTESSRPALLDISLSITNQRITIKVTHCPQDTHEHTFPFSMSSFPNTGRFLFVPFLETTEFSQLHLRQQNICTFHGITVFKWHGLLGNKAFKEVHSIFLPLQGEKVEFTPLQINTKRHPFRKHDDQYQQKWESFSWLVVYLLRSHHDNPYNLVASSTNFSNEEEKKRSLIVKQRNLIEAKTKTYKDQLISSHNLTKRSKYADHE